MRVYLCALLFALTTAPPGAARAGDPPATVVEGHLRRAQIDAVLARGPQRFIASLRVEPHLVKGRFVGFRIVKLMPDAALVNNRSIYLGDVIISVNDEPVERPEQFMRAWEVVGNADVLSVELLRGDRRLVYRWKID